MSDTPRKEFLCKGDVIVLKDSLSDGWWKCEINGFKSKIQINRFKDLRIRREKSDETHLSRSKQKNLHRQTSSKDSSTPSDQIQRSHSNDSPSPRLTKSSPQIYDSTISKPIDLYDIPKPPPLPKSFTDPSSSTKKRTSIKKRASKLFTSVYKDSSSLSRSESSNMIHSKSSNPKKNKRDIALNLDLSSTNSPFNDDDPYSKKSRRSSLRSTKKKIDDRDIRSITAHDLKDVFIDIENVKIEIQLIIKAINEESSIKSNEITYFDDRLPPFETPEQKILNKMLEEPFTALFSTNGKEIKTDIVLAPDRKSVV